MKWFKSLVRDWMTPDPVTVSADAGLADAYRRMLTYRVRRLPVVDAEGTLVGIITRSDIRQILPAIRDEQERSAAELSLGDMPMVEAMTWGPVTIAPDCPIRTAAELMLRHKVSGLPVVEGGRLVGIITESDIFRLIVETWDEAESED